MISIIRGDSRAFKFARRSRETHEIIEDLADEVTFTMRRYPEREIVMQKKLTKGGIAWSSEEHKYYLYFMPEDTRGICFGDYGFDIEVQNGNVVSTICVGKIRVTEEYTNGR